MPSKSHFLSPKCPVSPHYLSAEAKELAMQYGRRGVYVETSAKTGQNVSDLFDCIAQLLTQQEAQRPSSASVASVNSLNQFAYGGSGSGGGMGGIGGFQGAQRTPSTDGFHLDGAQQPPVPRKKCCFAAH